MQPSGYLNEKTLPEFMEKIELLLSDNHYCLVFDLSELDFISSHAMGYLKTMHHKLAATEKKMAFVNANEEIREVFEFIGLAKLVAMFDAEEKFLEAMGNEEI